MPKQVFEVKITAVPEEVIKADKVILPGVGDFFYCKNELLKIDGMVDAINYFIKEKDTNQLVFNKTIGLRDSWKKENG